MKIGLSLAWVLIALCAALLSISSAVHSGGLDDTEDTFTVPFFSLTCMVALHTTLTNDGENEIGPFLQTQAWRLVEQSNTTPETISLVHDAATEAARTATSFGDCILKALSFE